MKYRYMLRHVWILKICYVKETAAKDHILYDSTDRKYPEKANLQRQKTGKRLAGERREWKMTANGEYT